MPSAGVPPVLRVFPPTCRVFWPTSEHVNFSQCVISGVAQLPDDAHLFEVLPGGLQ